MVYTLGWDPCFEYEGQTYAEMDKEEKVSSMVLIQKALDHT